MCKYNGNKNRFLVLAITLVLLGCGGGGGSNTAQYRTSGSNNVLAVAAAGAPLANVPFTITKLDGTFVTSGTVGNDAALQAQLTSDGAPYLITVTDTGVSPTVSYTNLVLASDFGSAGTASLNVTPLSTIVTNIVLNTPNYATLTAADLATVRSQAADAVHSAIRPLMTAAGVTGVSSGADMLTKLFTPTSDPFDKVLDAISVSCAPSNCSITPNSAQASSSTGTLQISTTSVAAAQSSATIVKSILSTNSSIMLSSAPVVVVVSADSSWGSASDSWAGYSGKIAVYNFTDSAIPGDAKLYFESSKLQANGFWNATASVGNSKYLLTLPDWASLAPKTTSAMPKPFTLGFSGSGALASVTDLSACSINGKKCIILIDDGALNLSASVDTAVASRSWVNFVSSLPSTTTNKTTDVPATTTAPASSSGNQASGGASAGTGATSTASVVMSSTSSWSGGFNGQIALGNSTSTPWTSWSLTIAKPNNVTDISSWGNYVFSSSGNSVTFSNASWNGSVAPGKAVILGFGGSGSLLSSATISSCTITYNNGTPTSCQAAVSSSTTPTPTPTPTPTVTGSEPTTVAGSVHANQGGRVFVGYYPSWSDNWFSAKDWSGNSLSDDAILVASKMARIPGTYTHVVVAFAQPNFSYSTASNYTANTWAGTGLNFNAGPQDIKRAVDVLHARNMKVLVAVGGATYNDWAALATENGSASGPITNSLKQLLLDVGFDGLDVDYEVDGITTAQYTGAVNAMRKAVDLANASQAGHILTLAGWSTGADCTSATGTSGASASACGGNTSFWGGKSGGERLVFSQSGMAAKIDMVSIMSYDAQTYHYDGVTTWKTYRDLFPSSTIVNIGLETAPEGWAGGMLVVNDADAQCTGSTITQDQYGTTVNLPYSVNRYASAVSATPLRTNHNARDGAMIWQILKTATASCGTAKVASPATVAQKINALYGLPLDNRTGWQ